MEKYDDDQTDIQKLKYNILQMDNVDRDVV